MINVKSIHGNKNNSKNIHFGRRIIILAVLSLAVLVWISYGTGEEGRDVFQYQPLELISNGLRWLSFSSRIGNFVAILLYLMICFIPMGIFLRKIYSRNWICWDCFLVGISGVLFFVMYRCLNPSIIYKNLPYEHRSEFFLSMINFGIC